jgi:lipoyl(octanoyl) transferase
LILSEPASGAWNMALDEALLESSGAHVSLPTLRFYSWEPPCLSLGYAQPSSDADLAKLKKLGWNMVRRPTGGRAILHTDELTYSITASVDEPLVQGSILESYRRLSQALLAGLKNLGIHALAIPKKDGLNPSKKPVCFESPSDYEITVKGKKIIGSAQARRLNGVLQHGAIPFKGDLTRINQVLQFDETCDREAANKRLLSHAATLADVIGSEPSFQGVRKAFIDGFQNTFNLEFTFSEPTEKEIARTEELMKTKYDNTEWKLRI